MFVTTDTDQRSELYLSQKSIEMFNNDIKFETESDLTNLQEEQTSVSNICEKSYDNKDQTVVGIARETLKLIENDEELYIDFVNQLRQLNIDVMNKKFKKMGGVTDKGLAFPFTGKSTQKREKRKSIFY